MNYDECLCCGDVFPETQITPSGFCTMCFESRVSYNADGIPIGRPCCRQFLSGLRKEGKQADI